MAEEFDLATWQELFEAKPLPGTPNYTRLGDLTYAGLTPVFAVRGLQQTAKYDNFVKGYYANPDNDSINENTHFFRNQIAVQGRGQGQYLIDQILRHMDESPEWIERNPGYFS
jgi:hypothetical protein